MIQTAIPYIFMRGGTSRGPYFNRAHLPEDRDTLAQVLIAAVGSGHPLNIDGIGGGQAVTTKVAMLSKSEDDWADIDYFFAQVSVLDRQVDFKPSCGNILSGVAPAALEMGLIETTPGVTEVKIKAVNTGARIIAGVQTPQGLPIKATQLLMAYREPAARLPCNSWTQSVGVPIASCRRAKWSIRSMALMLLVWMSPCRWSLHVQKLLD